MGGLAAGAVAFLSFIGAGSAVAGVGTLVSVSYTAFSGYKAYTASKKARKRALAEQARSSFVNFRDPVPVKRAVFGEVRVGGPILFAHKPNNGKVHLFIALASHEVEEIRTVYIGDEPLSIDSNGNATGKYTGTVTVHKILGDSATELNDKMVAEGIGSGSGGPIEVDDQWAQTAGLYVVLYRYGRKFAGDDPQFSAIVKGFNHCLTGNVDDPGGYGLGWSDNPVECARTYMLNYMGVPFDRFADMSDAISYCDESVALKAGGTETRYTCNGMVLADTPHEQVLEAFANSFAGNIRYVAGQWHATAKPTEDLATVIKEADMLGTYRFDYNRSTRELPSAIRGTFVDPDRNWQEMEFPILDLSGGSTIDYLDLELLFTTSHTAAQRIAKIFLHRARAQESVRAVLAPKALRSIPGDVVTFESDRLGKTLPMEVVDSDLSLQSGDNGLTIEVGLNLQAYDSTGWDWDETTEEQELVDGDVDLGGIFSKGPSAVTAVDSIFNLTATAIRIDTAFQWTNPEVAPDGTGLDRTLLELAIEITTEDGPGGAQTTETVQASNNFSGSLGQTQNHTFVNLYTFPAGNDYVSYSVLTKRARSIYTDDTKSEWVDAP
jgi:hypothetical protein